MRNNERKVQVPDVDSDDDRATVNATAPSNWSIIELFLNGKLMRGGSKVHFEVEFQPRSCADNVPLQVNRLCRLTTLVMERGTIQGACVGNTDPPFRDMPVLPTCQA